MSRTVPYLRTAAWLLLALLFLYPLLWMALSSFKSSNAEIFGQPFSLPHQISFANYQKAIRQGNMGSCFINSFWVTGLTASAVVCFGAWAGFALSKARFPLRKFWLALFFIGMILPVQSYLIPLTGLLERLGIHDSLWALILSYAAQSLPVAVLLFVAFFRKTQRVSRTDRRWLRFHLFARNCPHAFDNDNLRGRYLEGRSVHEAHP